MTSSNEWHSVTTAHSIYTNYRAVSTGTVGTVYTPQTGPDGQPHNIELKWCSYIGCYNDNRSPSEVHLIFRKKDGSESTRWVLSREALIHGSDDEAIAHADVVINHTDDDVYIHLRNRQSPHQGAGVILSGEVIYTFLDDTVDLVPVEDEFRAAGGPDALLAATMGSAQ